MWLCGVAETLPGGVWSLLACVQPGPPAPSAPQVVEPAQRDPQPIAADPSALHPVELALDRGHFDPDTSLWTSEPGRDAVMEPEVVQAGDRAVALVAPGHHVAVIRRECGVVQVPFDVDAETTIVSLPYPRCGETGPAGVWSVDDVLALHGVGLLLDWPIVGVDVAVWATWQEAVSACGWYGRELAAGALPGPIGVWTKGGVAGGDLPDPVPTNARDHSIGVACGPPFDPIEPL